MSTRKEKAINLVLKGIALQFIPLMIFGVFAETEYFDQLQPGFEWVILLSSLGFLIIGYVFLIPGCLAYARYKGYPKILGWLGILSFVGLAVLLIIPIKNKNLESELLSIKNSQEQERPLLGINIPENLLLIFIALPVLYYVAIWIFCFLTEWKFADVMKNDYFFNIPLRILWFFHIAFILVKIAKRINLNLDAVFGFRKGIGVKLILVFIASDLVFNTAFNALNLYVLSFIFPGHVEELINAKVFTNLSELILYSIAAVILAPVVEELLCRGIILQKWSIKWGVRWGLVGSSLVFALYHFRYDIIPLFIVGIIYSSLYFRTSSLFTPILCHALNDLILIVWEALIFFRKSALERELLRSAIDYQNSINSHLGWYIFFSIISALVLAYLIYKIMPRNDEVIPYLKNKKVI